MNLSKVKIKTNELINYLKTRKERKLYRQWVDMADLPSGAVPYNLRGDEKNVR